jgi:Ran-binding protein 1
MSTNTDTHLDPKEEAVAASEPKLAQHETELATHPKGDESLESSNKPAATYTEAATHAASSAAETVTGTVGAAATSATGVAANMKDSVFSMFGGGKKKDRKEEDEEAVGEKSGSSKARKKAEEEEEVCCFLWSAAIYPQCWWLAIFVSSLLIHP